MTRNDDDARDIRAALGTLLADEPASPWTVQDDVARGRAYQRQRRTRWGAGIGVVAAAALVLGVVGPLRPSAPEIPVLGEVPTVEGVPQAWFDNITPALLDQTTAIVDWDRSSVRGSAATGFRADLALAPVTVTSSAGNRTIELADSDGAPGRLTLEWFPGRTEPGPALQRCTKDVCPNQGTTGFVGGPTDQAATAGKDAPFPEGTRILDRQYPQGMLEMVSYPTRPPDPLVDWAQLPIPSQFLSALGNPVLGPPAPPPGPDYLAAQRAIVEPYLAQRGYRITDALMPMGMSVDGRVRAEYTVTPTDGDGSLTASLFVTAYPSTIAGDPYPSGSYLTYCSKSVCTDVAVAERECADPATCPTTFAATTTSKDYVIGSGLQIALARYDDGTSMEVVASALECLQVCDPITAEPDAFLTRDQTLGLATALGRPEFATTPTPQPSTSGASTLRECTSGDVKLIAEPDTAARSAADLALRVRVIPRNEGVACALRGVPDVEARAVDRTLGYVVVPGQPTAEVALRGGGEAEFGVRLQICAPVGDEPSFLRVTMPGGGEPLDVQVGQFLPLVSCANGAGASTDLLVSGFASAAAPAPDDGGQQQTVAGYLAGLGIQGSGGPDYAGKGPVEPGGRYAGQYRLVEDGRESYATVVLELRPPDSGDLLNCTDSDLCAEYRFTESGTDTGGASYSEAQILLTAADSRYGPARSRVLERQYEDVRLRLIVAPWPDAAGPLLTAGRMTALADAVAVDARAAAGVPAAA